MSSTQPRPTRPTRRVGRVALVALLVLALASFWLLPSRVIPSLVEWAIVRAGDSAVAGGLALRVHSVGLSRLVAEDVRVGGGGDFTIGRVELAYRLAGLLRGELDAVSLYDARVRAGLSEEGVVSLPGRGAPGPTASDDTAGAAPRIAFIELESAHLSLETPDGVATAKVASARAWLDQGRGEIAGELGLDLAGVALGGPFESSLAEAGAEASVSLAGPCGSLAFELRGGPPEEDPAQATSLPVAPSQWLADPALALGWRWDATLTAALAGLGEAGAPGNRSLGGLEALEGRVALALSEGWLRLRSPSLRIAAQRAVGSEGLEGPVELDVGPLAPEQPLLALDLRGEPGSGVFALRLGARASEARADLRARGRFEHGSQAPGSGGPTGSSERARRFVLRLDECAPLRVQGEAVRALGLGVWPALALCPDPGGAPAFELDRGHDGAPERWAGRIAVPPVELSPAAGDATWPERLHTPDLALSAAGLGDGTVRGRVVASGGEALAESWLAAGLDADLAWELGDAGLGVRGRYALGELRDRAEPPAVRRLALRGEMVLAGDALETTAVLGDAAEQWSLHVSAHHALASGAGRAELALQPVVFGPGLRPASLSPRFPSAVAELTGGLEAGGTLSWGPGAPAHAEGTVGLRDVSFDLAGFPFRGISGQLSFTSVAPLRTGDPQRLRIALIEAGARLEDGEVEFALTPDGFLSLYRLGFELAGGTTQSSGRLNLALLAGDPEARGTQLIAQVLAVDLGELLRQMDVQGLSGEGTLDGALPVFQEEDGFFVRGGQLAARGPGWIRYRSGVPAPALGAGGQGGGVDLASRLLENFRYEELRATVEGEATGEIELGVRLRGANPDVLDGHPTEFNLTLSLSLLDLLRSVSVDVADPETIQRRLRQSGHR